MQIPEPRYTSASDGTSLAYQVVGRGRHDIVCFAFEDAGEHELKGVPDRRRLYRVVA